MYEIDRTTNRLIPLERKSFADLGFRERPHLQEWIAALPEILGEDLLIIQKEFDGFDGTRERLDLLALDRDGNLVTIENKPDDTGRDVVWQSIKYAAYVSTLDRIQIAEIYQSYLDRHGGGNAVELICEFLEVESLEEAVLNGAQSQRIIMIAASFRKEVTSPAIWLISHGIRVQCFQVAIFERGGDLFFDAQQIIPTRGSEDFVISIASKGLADRDAQDARARRGKLNLAFWMEAIDAMRASGATAFQNVSPGERSFLSSPAPGFAETPLTAY